MDAAEIILDTRIRVIERKITMVDRGFTREGTPSPTNSLFSAAAAFLPICEQLACSLNQILLYGVAGEEFEAVTQSIAVADQSAKLEYR
jgi:hypothetical protein